MKRKVVSLSSSMERALNTYALSACAAGVGALALAQPAEARIVYTPAHVVLTSIPHTSYLLDLNHDGINDFSLSGGYQFTQSGNVATLRCVAVSPPNAARIRPLGFELALGPGVAVGPGERFGTFDMGLVAYVSAPPPWYQGSWVNGGKGVKDRYLGLKFTIDGKIHYGWARLTVKVRSQYIVNLTATLTGYAYETIPNKPIIAGKTHDKDDVVVQPASLGLLAAGFVGGK